MLQTMNSMAMTNLNEKMETWLPPGFRFHPTDEELVTDYLTRKVLNNNFTAWAIAEVDLNKCEPWDLKERAKMGEKELYFFTLRDRKYPTGMRTNRATEAGYWKATGKDRDVISSRSASLVGMKKTLVFYRGRAPKGEKTNWIMHEYRIEGEMSHLQNYKWAKETEWVVCRIFQKMPGGKKAFLKDILKANFYNVLETQCSLPPLLESPIPTASDDQGVDSDSGFQNDHLSSFAKSSNRSISSARTQFVSWNQPRESSITSSLPVPQLATMPCNASDIGMSLMKYPSYVDVYNGQTCQASTSSNNVPKLKENLILQESLGSTSSMLSWKESERAEQYSNILQLENIRQCKIEPYVGPINETVQSSHKNLDNSEWIGENMGYDAPHLLHLYSTLTSENPINELYEMPAALYRNAAGSGGVELDCLWGC
ncbi:hypothetical protein O6H91_21G023800 [Diphasiastrum complanatum]|uniref:Uncharacterized protein n=1 Tax=Diphasiastrum complanatum TaxID=34168 RepID=A0ACC2AIV0_DIPCM|nr:hypothetical protein O6H91_21G023800 [Diphasiastrum complanatum]